MNVAKMHTEFKVLIDKIDSANSPNFLPEEIDLYLSDAQEQFIENKAYSNNFKRESVEETQKRVKDLQSITLNANIQTFSTNTNNKPLGTFVTLPTDYRHALQEEVSINITDCNAAAQSIRIPVKAITHDEYNLVLSNPFTKPSSTLAYRLPYGRFNSVEHFELITFGGPANLVTYHLRYLKNPSKIDKAQVLTPVGLSGTGIGELSDESYREIISLAISNALESIESPRYTTSQRKLAQLE